MRDELHRLLLHKPFQPFRVHLIGGTVHEVRTPDLARVGPFTLRLGCLDLSADPPAVVDQFFIPLDHVARVEPLLADEPVLVHEPT